MLTYFQQNVQNLLPRSKLLAVTYIPCACVFLAWWWQNQGGVLLCKNRHAYNSQQPMKPNELLHAHSFIGGPCREFQGPTKNRSESTNSFFGHLLLLLLLLQISWLTDRTGGCCIQGPILTYQSFLAINRAGTRLTHPTEPVIRREACQSD